MIDKHCFFLPVLFFLCLTGLISAQGVSYTLSYQVSSGQDDAEEDLSSGEVNLDNTTLELGKGADRHLLGMRFAGIQVPAGAKIQSSYLLFSPSRFSSVSTALNIKGELIADSAPFSNEAYDVSSRGWTFSTGVWNDVPTWNRGDISGIEEPSVSLTDLVQEIVNQREWKTGNAMTFFIFGEGSRNTWAAEKGDQPPIRLVINFELNSFVVEGFPFGSSSLWRYNDGGLSLDAQPWNMSGYADQTWRFGAGLFGFGSDGIQTTLDIGDDPSDKVITHYFRKVFNYSSSNRALQQLELSLLHDSGAVAYLNGTEILRDNMPEGEITNSTLALGEKENLTRTGAYQRYSLAPELLVEGENVLAVRVHLSDPADEDLLFDCFITDPTLGQPAVALEEKPTAPLAEVPADASLKAKLEIYPNPSDGTFMIGGNVEDLEWVEVRSVGGQLIGSWKGKEVTREIDLTGNAGGVYEIRAFDGEKVLTNKFVKR